MSGLAITLFIPERFLKKYGMIDTTAPAPEAAADEKK
jgi:hypothetical protein